MTKNDIEKAKFYKYLQNNINPNLKFEQDLGNIIFLPIDKLKEKSQEIKKELEACFGKDYQTKNEYAKIKDKYDKAYNKLRDEIGTQIVQEKNYMLCPYCRANYIRFFENDKKMVKPDLDHYYPKSKYPYFAVTISNLIPSCSFCNQRLKRDNEPLIDFDDTQEIFNKLEFEANVIEQIIYINIYSFKNLSNNEKKWLKQMMIEENYSNHTEILENLLSKADKYKSSRICEIAKNIGLPKEEIYNIVFAEYDIMKETNEPLFKLKQDLYKQLIDS
ncbi:HNH endonuclease family protein [Campylobacter ureolyticus]|uniref:HNH domain-containing protein n=1 Tax=Campylobacter ureolyticus TaxID=827 RepID=A0AAE7E9S0_9BACT|nr:hypothetical protein [Campylobacter ureolyticus]MCR8685576.1 hypothetical protein [Campylobacter ureolyticus]QKF84180.1 hypothetical protein CURT_0677 [Campylobacter ureolyticus]QQY35660.1 hypothetical protein I6I59_09180 [Campylobacter ureolyticus]SUX23852.1 Uncharacterised protein [Campylobacter ureolyticus]